MALIVQKYGGTSVETVERIRAVADRILLSKEQGNDLVVVVSAMGQTTDNLIKLACKIDPHPSERELDMLISTGEQVSAALLTMALHYSGMEAISLTGSQVGLITDIFHTRARIKFVECKRILSALKKGYVVVVAGFQGINENSDITTLGRGGSDTTAVAIAAAMKADVCEIYSDVDGVFTADPDIVTDVSKIARISYDEMLEMAGLGAKILQTRSVEFAKKFNVLIHVRSSFNIANGTYVTDEGTYMEDVLVTGVTYCKDEAKITIGKVPDRPGIASSIFGELAKKNIVVDMIIQNMSEDGYTDISFTVASDDLERAIKAVSDVAIGIGAEKVISDADIAKVSIVGVGMRSHSGVAYRMFKILADKNINIIMISTSEIKISCIIGEEYVELAVRSLHKEFGLSKGNGAKNG